MAYIPLQVRRYSTMILLILPKRKNNFLKLIDFDINILYFDNNNKKRKIFN
jgi:hypothetical protein